MQMRLLLLVALSSYLVRPDVMAQARQPAQTPDAPSAIQQESTQRESTNPLQSGVAMFLTLQKKSVVFPDLATAHGPLSSWNKCELAANNSVAVSTVSGALAGAAFGQVRNRPAGYGQEFGGYGKRFGADMARAASNNLFGTCLLASVTHQDPRFYVKKQLPFRESLKYAASRLIMTRNDSGAPVVDYSGLLGPLAGETLANAYYPQGSRGVSETLIRYAADMGWRFGGNLLRQYWPRINRRLQLASE
jgi:hypothetical protein